MRRNGKPKGLEIDDLIEMLKAAKESGELLEKIVEANDPHEVHWIVPTEVRQRLIAMSGFDDSE